MLEGSSCAQTTWHPYTSSTQPSIVFGEWMQLLQSYDNSVLYFFFLGNPVSRNNFPEQRITRFTSLAEAAGSSMTSLNAPEVKSFKGEITCGCLSKDLGEKTTHGFLNGHATCLRSKWKKLAGVVGFATIILYSADCCRNLSGRQLECSGP